MPRIPMGNFGQRGPDPVLTGTVRNPGQDDAAAMAGVGDTLFRIGANGLAEQRQADDDLARAKAANALLHNELELRTLATDVGNRVATGELDYREAPAYYEERAGAIAAPTFEGLDPATAEHLKGGITRNRYGAQQAVQQVVDTAKRADFRGQFATALDQLGKIAGEPGADPEALIARARSFAPLALSAEIPADQVEKTLQDFSDKLWTQHATRRYIAGREDQATLTQLEQELTAEDGFYTARLDVDKRNALLAQVSGGRIRLEAKVETDLARREANADRQITFLRDAIATGQEVSADRWALAGDAVKGTAREGELQTVRKLQTEVLTFRVKPFAEQAAYLRALEVQVRTTPSDDPKRDLSRLTTLRAAADASRKQATESPLTFYANQTGQQVAPLDIAALAQGDTDRVVAQLAERQAILGSLRKTYGPEVSEVPWLPEEAALLGTFFRDADDRGRLMVLSMVSKAMPTPQAYAAALKPIAAEKPQYLAAGLAMHQDLKGPDGTHVAETILAGARILEDKSVPLPSDDKLRLAFDARVGEALPAGSTARATAWQVFQASYAGLGAQRGVRHSEDGGTAEVHEDLADAAIDLSTGGVSEINGRAVIRPYGMAEDVFEQRVTSALRDVAGTTGFTLSDLEDLPLVQGPAEGVFYLLNDGALQLDPTTGKPLTVTVQ